MLSRVLWSVAAVLCAALPVAPDPVLVPPGELADLAAELAKARGEPEPVVAHPESGAHGVSEIGLERTRCYGPCPQYTVLLSPDGTVRYHGGPNAPRKGDHTGHIDPGLFNQLAWLVVETNYMDLEPAYTARISDNPGAYTTAVVAGRRHVVYNYAEGGPATLWALQQMIDQVVERTKWDSIYAPK